MEGRDITRIQEVKGGLEADALELPQGLAYLIDDI